VLAFWAEVRLFTDLRGHYGPFYGPIWFYLASTLLCGFALLAHLDRPRLRTPALRSNRLLWSCAALLVGGLGVLYAQAPIIMSSPVSITQSDVILILQAYVDRFRSGEIVYRYLTNLPYPLFPNHLPLQWLPYVPADALGIDYRWWALGIVLLIGFGAYMAFLNAQRLHWLLFGAAALLPAVVLRRMIVTDHMLFAQVVEFTIIAYYCALVASIFSRSALLQAVALVLCLLSRYSVIFWVPVFLWILWRERGHVHAFTVAAFTALGIVLIYVKPFLSEDWTIFTHALSEYKIATFGEWTHTNGGDSKPIHLFTGLGFGSFFYTYVPGDIATRIAWIQKAHILCSLGAAGIGALTYWQLRRRIDYRVLALVSLSFYLTTFYAFIQIPYAYLISLTVFVSAFVVVVAFCAPTSLAVAQQQDTEPDSAKRKARIG